MDKETPVTKYLAMLERRQSRMDMQLGSPSPGVSPNTPVNIRQRLRFDDHTFLEHPNDDHPDFHYSPPPLALATPIRSESRSKVPSFISTYSKLSNNSENEDGFFPRSTSKRKRYSFEEKDEDEENSKKISKFNKFWNDFVGYDHMYNCVVILKLIFLILKSINY